MNHKLAKGMKMWKGNGNSTTLFSLKGLEIVHQETRGYVKPMVMEHLNDILFHKPEPASKQHINQPTNTLLATPSPPYVSLFPKLLLVNIWKDIHNTPFFL